MNKMSNVSKIKISFRSKFSLTFSAKSPIKSTKSCKKTIITPILCMLAILVHNQKKIVHSIKFGPRK